MNVCNSSLDQVFRCIGGKGEGKFRGTIVKELLVFCFERGGVMYWSER